MGHGAVATELLTICLLGCCFGVAISACNPDGTRDGHDGAPLIATVGAPCDAVDDRDIEATAKCFYQLKSAVGTYRFLASAVQKETPRVEWEAGVGPCQYSRKSWKLLACEAKVLGTSRKDGTSFARVSISAHFENHEQGCSSSTWTQTWVQEQGRWRYMVQPKLEDIAAAQWKAGDYQAAAESFAKLLAKDPFSVFAYTGQLTALANRGARLPGRGVQDLVRGTLGVNSEDSRALAAAADATSDFQVAEMFIRKLAPTDCSYSGAVFNVALKALEQSQPRIALGFLDGHKPKYEDSELTLLRIGALADLARKEDLKTLLTEGTVASVRQALETEDPSFAGSWAANIARALLLVGNVRAAGDFVEAGLRRDPESKKLRDLLRRVAKEANWRTSARTIRRN
jgi:tetratricopeptide (TPR) repeat protein